MGLCINAIKQVGTDCVEITSSEGPVFFVRLSYLTIVSPASLAEGASFSDEETDDIISAGQSFAVEKKCDTLLARSEQCRAGLERKMLQKGFAKPEIARALDYLEQKRYLSDERFSAAWLRTHALSKCQGRTRLLNELLSRGIGRQTAQDAVNDFFAENDEATLCRKAIEKAMRANRTGDKLITYLLNSGFPYKMITAELRAPTEERYQEK